MSVIKNNTVCNTDCRQVCVCVCVCCGSVADHQHEIRENPGSGTAAPRDRKLQVQVNRSIERSQMLSHMEWVVQTDNQLDYTFFTRTSY